MKEIYEIVRSLREDHDLKQKDVADYLNLSRTTYNHYELGHTTFTADMIIELAKLFHTTPNVLLDFDTSSEVTNPDLLKLFNVIKKENIDISSLIELIYACKNL